ncbi:hypothetical protein DFH09DRAFT_1470974 [Mycena vulgaris]|nr:hypothetical protein DFH09DRAFT_1470974 [Mycena vulgaris]
MEADLTASDPSTPKSARHAARAQIPELDREIKARVDERNSCEDLLDAYKYPVLTLPNEITSEIFLRFLPSPPERPFPFGLLTPTFLCQICRQWRDLALSTPALWSAIDLNLEEGRRYPQKLAILRAWLQRSKNCPLSVALRCSQYFHVAGTAAFVEALVLHSARWADMVLMFPFQKLGLIQGDKPRLRKVTFGPIPSIRTSTPVPAPMGVFDRAPNLTSVILSASFNPFTIVLPWSQITTLQGYLYCDQITEILRHTARLERCEVAVATSDLLMDRTTIPPLSHLSYLSLQSDGDSCESAIHLLDALVLPALRVLQFDQRVLDGKPENDVAVSTFVSFVSRMQSLEELRITDSHRPQGFYHGIFPDSTFQIDANYRGYDARFDF